MYLHQIELTPMAAPEIAQKLHDGAGDALMQAVLHTLRDKHAEITEAGHEPPLMLTAGSHAASTAPTAAEYRAYHAGAATALKEVFFLLRGAGDEDA